MGITPDPSEGALIIFQRKWSGSGDHAMRVLTWKIKAAVYYHTIANSYIQKHRKSICPRYIYMATICMVHLASIKFGEKVTK